MEASQLKIGIFPHFRPFVRRGHQREYSTHQKALEKSEPLFINLVSSILTYL